MKSKQFKTIAGLLVLVGAIFGIVLGFACQIPTYSVWYDSHKEYAFNVGLMLETWIFFDLLALFFGWLASVLEKLENIERSVCEVNNIHEKLEMKPTENEWQCPKCGRINQNYVGTCGCGEVKP